MTVRVLVWMKTSAGMPGTTLSPIQSCDFGFRHCNPNTVVTHPGFLVFADIG